MGTLTLAALDLPLLNILAAGFTAAWVLGLVTQRLGLSPIVGYLLAGVVIGPYTPGFIGDEKLAHELAELGVILMMFGVGLHFHLKDLLAVKSIAIPGAIVQSAVATLTTMVIFHSFGWEWKSSMVLGMAMAVASTVVLLRVLIDKQMLTTVHGHVAVGWLIVEDIFTILALVLVPLMAVQPVMEGAAEAAAAGGGTSGLMTIVWALGKLAVLVALVLVAGSKIVPWILMQVAKLRSRELFTLTVLVLSIAIAVGSAVFFGASVALGAFLAGMVVAQSPASHQAAADALPMRDAFAVLFFVSVGMLFNPSFIIDEPLMVAAALVVVLVAKPLAAIFIVCVLGYPARTALTVAIGLGQIGEFSFILGQVALANGLIPQEGMSVLVVAAMISITLNPLVFKSLGTIERFLEGRKALWKLMNARSETRRTIINAHVAPSLEASEKPLAVIVGYGPVGRVADALLRDAGFETTIIEMNMDTVEKLVAKGRIAVYGDASKPDILELAGIKHAVHLVITLADASNRNDLVLEARELNKSIEITVRARYISELSSLQLAGANKVVFEEGEVGLSLAKHVMLRQGLDEAKINKMLTSIRKLWGISESTRELNQSPETTLP